MPTFLPAAAWPDLITQGSRNSLQEIMCLQTSVVEPPFYSITGLTNCVEPDAQGSFSIFKLFNILIWSNSLEMWNIPWNGKFLEFFLRRTIAKWHFWKILWSENWLLAREGAQEARQAVSTFDLSLPGESGDQKLSILRAKEPGRQSRSHQPPCLVSINNFNRSPQSVVIKSNQYLQPENVCQNIFLPSWTLMLQLSAW